MNYIGYFFSALISIGILSVPISMVKEYLQVSYEHKKTNKIDKKVN
jgi:hypothetical protein